MNRLRRHRWRTLIALLAIGALLWAQLVSASRPDCSPGTSASTSSHADHAAAAPRAEPSPCHGSRQAAGSAICTHHCNPGDLGKEAGRVLAVPMVEPVPSLPLVAFRHLARGLALREAAPPRAARHRPTAHPASLLLI